jgi:phosphopantothenoylcysteine decarboxylase/phosphopantothenoylcysteine decarboxylase/phosphopantothenate--cysteine ligase
MNTEATVVLGVSGSIAAYKACELASGLRKAGCQVFVAMTPEAAKLVTPLTFQTLSRNPVLIDVFEEQAGWQPGHIQLADEADLLLIAPASANILASMAYGFANDALTAIALATRAPILIAPAMNGKMWTHASTLENVAKLKSRGVSFIDPAEGRLACGYEGVGRLAPVEEIAAAAVHMLTETR